MGIPPTTGLTLQALGTCGAVLPVEQQAVIETSLPLKMQEAGLHELKLWGKIKCANGKDYLVAQGLKKPSFMFQKKLNEEKKTYYSQDGFKWLDLEPVAPEAAARCLTIKGLYTGEPGKVYEVLEAVPVPEAPPPPELKEGEEPPPPAEEVVPPEPLKFELTELQRLKTFVDRVSAATSVLPRGATLLSADNALVANPLFPGLAYPGKLESYFNASTGPDGPSIAGDVPGSWAVQYNDFTQLAVVRSQLWPGYFAYYSGATRTYGDLYFGEGADNKDLLFMV